MRRKGKGFEGLAVVAILALWGLAASGLSWAEGEGPAGTVEAQQDLSWTERKAKLLQLKQTDPERFRRVMEENRTRLRDEMERLKETDPQKYEEVKARVRQERVQRWERMKEEDPEAFRKMIEARKRRLEEKMEELKNADPQRYEQLMEEKEKMMELRRTRREDPQAWNRHLGDHPELKDRRARHRKEWEGASSGAAGAGGGSAQTRGSTRGARP